MMSIPTTRPFGAVRVTATYSSARNCQRCSVGCSFKARFKDFGRGEDDQGDVGLLVTMSQERSPEV